VARSHLMLNFSIVVVSQTVSSYAAQVKKRTFVDMLARRLTSFSWLLAQWFMCLSVLSIHARTSSAAGTPKNGMLSYFSGLPALPMPVVGANPPMTDFFPLDNADFLELARITGTVGLNGLT